jgi:hypothetical protein
MIDATYTTIPSGHAKSLADEVHFEVGPDDSLYVAVRSYGFTSGDGYLTHDDALDLLAELAAHYGYDLADREHDEYVPDPVYTPHADDICRVTVDHPLMANLRIGDRVHVIDEYVSDSGAIMAEVTRIGDRYAERWRVLRDEHLVVIDRPDAD